MKRDIAELWVGTLRSGKYKQTEGYLKDTGVVKGKKEAYHCCLGVLTDLYVKENGCSQATANKLFRYDPKDKRWNGIKLPGVVMEWSGVSSGSGYLPKGEIPPALLEGVTGGCLADLNDNGCNFDTIAEVIELTYKAL